MEGDLIVKFGMSAWSVGSAFVYLALGMVGWLGYCAFACATNNPGFHFEFYIDFTVFRRRVKQRAQDK